MKIYDTLRGFFKRTTPDDSVTLIAPCYDAITKRLADWASAWELNNMELYRCSAAQHRQALAIVHRSNSNRRLFFFLGHGSPSGLLTKPSLGKVGSPICNEDHGCLLDTDDLKDIPGGLQVIAWACDAGKYFGPRVAALHAGRFLGFRGKVSLVFNDSLSEELWSSIIKSVFERVQNNGSIMQSDAEWLRLMLLELRRRIATGEIDTGYYNRINSVFLKKAAEMVVVNS